MKFGWKARTKRAAQPQKIGAKFVAISGVEALPARVWRRSDPGMTAVEIINEIKHLPPGEQARVVRFVRVLDEGRQLSGQELGELGAKLAEESNPARAEALKDQIAAGFYGEERHA